MNELVTFMHDFKRNVVYGCAGYVMYLWLVSLSPYKNIFYGSAHPEDIGCQDVSSHFNRTKLIFPVAGKSKGDIISGFGEERGDGQRKHEGIDIPALKGTAVLAVEDGIVTKIANHGNGGKQIWIQTENFIYFYAHLNAFMVDKNKIVKRGEKIGEVGTTGNASKGMPHLHFAIFRNDHKALDPVDYL